uniref:Uncharacterized protein n=2 Tax=Haemonchus contortus TaxID=6289 RepID=W6NEU3_HAECO
MPTAARTPVEWIRVAVAKEILAKSGEVRSQTDEASKICAKQLLLLRFELKEALRAACSDENFVEEMVLNTGLTRESVVAILKKHGYRDETERNSQDIENEEYKPITPKSANSRSKEDNVAIDVPKIDISEVRNDRHSPEDESLVSAHVAFEEIPQSPRIQQIRKASPRRGAADQYVESSPREVTDSSAEISDLAKRFGARLYEDATLVDRLRNVNREKSFVEQLRDIISTSATLSTVQLKFIPSVPLANPTHAATICKEIDVQTSICVTELPAPSKELRDHATDVPSLEYLSASDLGGLKQLPEAFATQEDASSSAFSSDQSAGQIVGSMLNRANAVIPFGRDGSLQITTAKTVRVSEVVEDSLLSGAERDDAPFREPTFAVRSRPTGEASPRTPRVSESPSCRPWRPSSRRLYLGEVEISTSQETDSLEVVSLNTPEARRLLEEVSSIARREDVSGSSGRKELRNDIVKDEHSTNSSDLSHQDEEHTYNQVSQIVSE